jgi:hypothetical protein
MPDSRFFDTVRTHSDRLITALLAVTIFTGYLATISPDIQWLDSSELQGAALLLDNAHPPGEPLYSVVTHAARWIPMGSLAFRVTVLSSLCTLLALLSVYGLLLRFGGVAVTTITWHHRLMGFSLTLLMAFSYAAWSQSTRSEVYALNFLLTVIIFNLCLPPLTTIGRFSPHSHNGSGDSDHLLKHIYIISFLLGLSAGNHSLLMALMAPAILTFLILPNLDRLRLCGLVACALFFASGLSVYLYLPIRAAASPPINWGNPESPERMIWMITAKMFQKSFHISMGRLLLNVRETVFMLMAQLTPPVFFAGILGLWLIIRRSMMLGGFLIFLLIGNLISVVSQEVFIGTNPDLFGYLLLSNLILIVGVYWALTEGLHIFDIRKLGFKGIATFACCALLVGLILSGLPGTVRRVNQHGNYSANLFAKSVLSAADVNSHLFTSNIATYFTASYLQNVERYRQDITLIHRPFLTFDWYVENLRQKHPRLNLIPPGHFKAMAVLLAHLKNQSIYFELGLGISDHLVPNLSPAGLLFKYHDIAVPIDKGPIMQARSRMARLDKLLTAGTYDVEALKALYWRHYCQAMFYAQRELFDQARWEFERCLALSPNDKEIPALLTVLETELETGQKGHWSLLRKRIIQ